MQAIIHDFSSPVRRFSYNFHMPNVFYVQLREMQQPCKIEAEKIEERGAQNTADGRLVLKNNKDEVVGDFKSTSVVGWWKQFD